MNNTENKIGYYIRSQNMYTININAKCKMEVSIMPQNKREDLIYSVPLVFIMTIWMCT